MNWIDKNPMLFERLIRKGLNHWHPHFSEKEEKVKRRLVMVYIIIFCGLITDAVLLTLPAPRPVTILLLVMLLTKPGLIYLLHKGYERLVNYALPLFYFISSSTAVVLGGTIRTPSSTIMILCIALAGFLVGRNYMFVNSGLCILVLLGVYLGEQYGWLPAVSQHSTLYNLTAFAATAIIYTIAIDIAIRSINKSFQSLEVSETALEERNEELFREILERNIADERRRISERKYRALFEGSRDALMLIDPPDWHYSSWNQAARDLFGNYSADEVKSLTPWALAPTYQPDGILSETKAKRSLENMLLLGAYFFEWLHQRKDGTLFPCQVVLSRLEIDQQVMILATVRDITDTKHVQDALRSSEEKYRRVIENILDAYYRTDREGIVRMASPSATRMFGFNIPEEMTGRSSREYFADEETRDLMLAKILETGSVNDFEVMMKRHDESIFPASVTAKIIHDEYGYYDGNEGIIRDITERRRANLALRESEERYRTVFEDSVLGIFQSTPGGNYIQVNPAFAQIFGYDSPQQMIAEVEDISSRTYADPEDRDIFLQAMDAKGYVKRFEVRGRRRNGEIIWISENVRVVKDENDRILRYEGTVEDITERKTAEDAQWEAESLFRHVIDAAPWGMHFYDLGKDGQLVFKGANPVADQILRIDHQSLLGKTLQHLASQFSLVTWIEKIMQVARTGEPWTEEKVQFVVGGIPGIYQIFAFETLPGRIVVSFQDVTARIQAEDEIRYWNATLETRVQQRTAELEATNQELEAFAYSVSHDLRAPLRSIDGFSRALLEDYSEKMDPAALHYVQRVNSAAQRMGQLIEDLLKLSRVTRSEMRRTSVNLSAMVARLTDEIQETNPERDVTWVIAPDVVVQADERLLEMVMKNLLGNAWKYTSQRDRATIEFGRTHEGGVDTLFILDNGVGFDMTYREKMFGAFQRLHGDKEFEGTGIGLAIVQRIIHRHGGRVWAEGIIEGGATIFFTLPEER